MRSAREREQNGNRRAAGRSDDHRRCRASTDQRQPKAGDQGHDAGDAGDAEAGNDEDLESDEQHTDRDKQRLLPARGLDEPLAPEEQPEQEQANRARHRLVKGGPRRRGGRPGSARRVRRPNGAPARGVSPTR